MSPPPHHNLFDSRGNPVGLGKKVGSGGEGDVYEIAPHRMDVLAKIYHKPLTTERQEKLRLMVSGCNDDLKEFAAWPLDLLHTGKNGPVCGFVMPRITDCEPIHKVYGPSHRKESFPNADWKFLVRTAKNLAAAFYIIHKYGYVVGDVNEGNILVTKKACVRLIDCDSFQVQTRDTIYHCEVGVAQFTPPELQKSKDFKMLRTQNHDNFGLAILIFLLLFMGRHPFSGVYKGTDDMPIERAIAEHRFAFGRSAALKAMAPPPNSVGLSVVPGEVASLFEQAFTESGIQSLGRPSANDWWNVLDVLEKRLKKCPTESMHTYYTGLATCPWCTLENSSGILLFLSSDTISRIDVAAEWQKVLVIKPPGSIPVIDPRKYRCLPAPLSPDIARALRFRKVRQAAAALLLVISAGLTLWLWSGSFSTKDFAGLVPAVLAGLLLMYPGRDTGERKRRKKEFEDTRYSWRLWEKKWKAEAGDAEFTAQLGALTALKGRYEAIEREYKNALVTLQHTSRERQEKKFLENCFIDSCTSPKLGENRKAALRSFGIETAADIAPYKIMSIPGFDTALATGLMNWRKQQESRFVFDEQIGVSASDVQGLIHTFQPKIRPVERELLMGIEKLHAIQQKIFKNRVKFQPVIEKSARDLAQAHADLSVFTLTGKLF
ncbi:helix-hairpin-helix domain-containing protein [Methanoregula sp.]|uniref:helix-hairpin-helix domain-containing protein n=1 Tax=Methanoregula sp. TaxID=2052170 RepID=UPI00356156D9